MTNKNMCDINLKPEEIYQTVKRKSVTKGNEKLRAEINCENRFETLYLTDSGDVNITEVQAIQAVLMMNFVLIKRKE